MIYGQVRPSVHVQLKITMNTCGSYLNPCGQVNTLFKFYDGQSQWINASVRNTTDKDQVS